MALLQPDTPLDFPDPVFIIFYLSHGSMLLAIGHASIALENRPNLDSVKRAIVVSLIAILVIYFVNLMLDDTHMATGKAQKMLKLALAVGIVVGIVSIWLMMRERSMYEEWIVP